MKYVLVCEMGPSGVWGLPQEGSTIIPSGAGPVMGDGFHVGSMKKIGWGTMSRYREDSQRVSMKFIIGNASCRMEDNYLFIEIEDADPIDVQKQARYIGERFLKVMEVCIGRYFSLCPIVFSDEKGKTYPIQRAVNALRVAPYSLDQLREKLDLAVKYYCADHERLGKAFEYYEFGLYLNNELGQEDIFFSRNANHVASTILLFMWKAITVIIGDRAVGDNVQKRVSSLGYSDSEWETKLGELKKYRDDYGIAHYSLDEEKLKAIRDQVEKAITLTAGVIRNYCEYLLKNGSQSHGGI